MTTINTRIKEVRKKRKYSQKDFADLLGITQSGVSYIEQNGSNVKSSIIKSICSQLSINEAFLVKGELPMFIDSEKLNLNDFFKEKGASDLELEILKSYFEIDENIRHAAIEQFQKNIIEHMNAKDQKTDKTHYIYDDIPDTLEELENLYVSKDLNKNMSDAG